MPRSIKAAALETILRQTLEAVEQGKEEIFAIAEGARQERERVWKQLEKVREEARQIVDRVDALREQDREARRHLAEVSRQFDRYTEEDIRRAYDAAREIQVKLALLQEREKQLLARRRELEATYRQLEETQQRAERLMSRVGVAMDFLSRSLEQISGEEVGPPEAPEVARAVIQAQEEERRRIARGIHDGPAQNLARLVMQAEYCQKLWEVKPKKLPEELRSLKEQARATLEEIRKIIFDLSPVNLGGGVVKAIERYVADFRERTGLAVNLEVCGPRLSYSPQVEVTAFRIVQEALNNVYKHAGVRSVRVILDNQPHSLAAAVEDDGCGFVPEAEREGETFGLTSMREWAALVNGRLVIESRPGRGTAVRFSVEV